MGTHLVDHTQTAGHLCALRRFIFQQRLTRRPLGHPRRHATITDISPSLWIAISAVRKADLIWEICWWMVVGVGIFIRSWHWCIWKNKHAFCLDKEAWTSDFVSRTFFFFYIYFSSVKAAQLLVYLCSNIVLLNDIRNTQSTSVEGVFKVIFTSITVMSVSTDARIIWKPVLIPSLKSSFRCIALGFKF